MKVQLLNGLAKLPIRGSKEAAGLDICSTVSVTVPAGGFADIPTGIAATAAKNHFVRVMPRSGLWFNNRVSAEAGVIDRDYNGEIIVGLHNRSSEDLDIRIGDKIAQLVEVKIDMSDPEVVEYLEETDRGSNGFGSTGMK